jgi:hypothetical protein
VLAKEKPELKDLEPFKTVLSGDLEAIGKLPLPELIKFAAATLTRMTTEQFQTNVRELTGDGQGSSLETPLTLKSPTSADLGVAKAYS